jgi:hypothetical protein
MGKPVDIVLLWFGFLVLVNAIALVIEIYLNIKK